MVIVLASCGNGYCGCESEDVFFFDENTPNGDINDVVYQWAVENAESFAYMHFGWDKEYSDEGWEDYIENHLEFDYHSATYEEYVEWCENWGYEPKALVDVI